MTTLVINAYPNGMDADIVIENYTTKDIMPLLREEHFTEWVDQLPYDKPTMYKNTAIRAWKTQKAEDPPKPVSDQTRSA